MLNKKEINVYIHVGGERSGKKEGGERSGKKERETEIDQETHIYR